MATEQGSGEALNSARTQSTEQRLSTSRFEFGRLRFAIDRSQKEGEEGCKNGVGLSVGRSVGRVMMEGGKKGQTKKE